MGKTLNQLKNFALSTNHLLKFFKKKILDNAIKSNFKLELLDEPPQGNVLVLSPHPDDDVFGCGGSIAKHTRNGDIVTILYLTGNAKRKEEAQNASRILGTTKTIFWDLEDGSITSSDNLAKKIADIINATKPQSIYVPAMDDPHSDHSEIAFSLAKALKLQESKIFDGQVLSYEVWQPIFANRLIKIDDSIETKIAAMKCHASQLEDRNYLDAIIGLNQYRGGMHNAGKYAEAFYSCNRDLYIKLSELIAK
jgi:LmbE family N-acetylglucosaminyl deacetylase